MDEAAAMKPEAQKPLPGGELGLGSAPVIVVLVGVTAILYVGRDVFLPVAIALLLTFALAPIVSFLRRRSIPRIPAVIITVTIAFAVIGMIGFLLATQVASLAQNIPTYQSNIVEKVRSLREMGAEGGIIDRVTRAVENVGAELQRGTQAAGEAAEPPQRPLPVEIVSRQNPLDTLQNVIVPLIAPFATAGLIVVVVVFMLLEREDLRDRFIRIVGYSDLNRTTEALEEAGGRVGRYLLMQLVINVIYAVPIGIGLWLLGIPNALLWGVLALMLRFVPYIGPAIGMMLPLLLALAVAPGWSLLLWTAAMFLVMELISNNVLEPWLYGSRTGLSPLAIILSAIFWTWLWGPLGLVLSTPLTVCLVVLGRHVPRFELLDVMLGNEPVLAPHERLYQRLLAGDPDEATDHAEDFLREEYLVDFYERVGIPALLLGEQDRQRGAMQDDRLLQFSTSAHALVANLDEIAEQEENEEDDPTAEGEVRDIVDDLPDGEGRHVLCAGGRGEIDDAAALMLAQVLRVQGAEAAALDHHMLQAHKVRDLPLDSVDTVIVAFLNGGSAAQARHIVRRLKRARPGLRVGVYMPAIAVDASKVPLTPAEELNADFLAATVEGTVISGLATDPAVRLKVARARVSRRRVAPRDVEAVPAAG